MSRQPTPAAWGMSAGALVTRLARVAETITITSSITPSTCLGPPALACGSLARCSAHEARRSKDRPERELQRQRRAADRRRQLSALYNQIWCDWREIERENT